MKSTRSLHSRIALALLVVGTALTVSACGGGGGEPSFEIGARVDGLPVPDVAVLPGSSQTIYMPVGHSFDLYADGPVTWTVSVGGSEIPGVGNTIYYAGATIVECFTSSSRFSMTTSASHALSAPVTVTLVATSLIDAYDVAVVDVVLTD